MTPDKAPRRWRLESLFEDGDDLPVVKEGPSVSGYDAEIEVIEASAYDAIEAERDELKAVKGVYEEELRDRGDAIDTLKAELQRERRKVEKLREQRSFLMSVAHCGEVLPDDTREKMNAELEAIDKGDGDEKKQVAKNSD